MLMAGAVVLVSFAVLAWSAEQFVFGASVTARTLGVTPLVIGMTIVGFGTSAPELLISAFAALGGNTGLALGNAVGSNIINIALVIGCTALLAPLSVSSRLVRREIPLLLGCTLLAGALVWDRHLGRGDGLLLLAALAGVLSYLVLAARRARGRDALGVELAAHLTTPVSPARALGWLLASLIILLLSARTLVWGAVIIAERLGVSDLIIGLTIVALGTSLPELAASVASALKREHDIALGNVIGSNIFNILGVFALPGVLHPGAVPAAVVTRDLPYAALLGTALLVMALRRGLRPARIGRTAGAVLLGAFVLYQLLLFHDA